MPTILSIVSSIARYRCVFVLIRVDVCLLVTIPLKLLKLQNTCRFAFCLSLDFVSIARYIVPSIKKVLSLQNEMFVRIIRRDELVYILVTYVHPPLLEIIVLSWKIDNFFTSNTSETRFFARN